VVADDPSTSERVRRARAARAEAFKDLVLRRTKLEPPEVALFKRMFPEILKGHHKLVWDRLRRRGLDVPEAEDLVQETFKLFFERVKRVGFPDSIAAMLQKITKGLLLNHVRNRKRAPMSVAIPSSGFPPPGSVPGVDSALNLREIARRLLLQLSTEHQEAVEKVLLNGLSYAEAARALGLPEGTVRARVVAAKEKLTELATQFIPISQRCPR
jgi:RNA polymerase sigma-70 factor (ECF subfamily)